MCSCSWRNLDHIMYVFVIWRIPQGYIPFLCVPCSGKAGVQVEKSSNVRMPSQWREWDGYREFAAEVRMQLQQCQLSFHQQWVFNFFFIKKTYIYIYIFTHLPTGIWICLNRIWPVGFQPKPTGSTKMPAARWKALRLVTRSFRR